MVQYVSLGEYPVSSNKELQKTGRGWSDYHADNNSGIMVVKLVDNNVVQFVSNFIGIEPMTSIERRCKKVERRCEKKKEKYSLSANSKAV